MTDKPDFEALRARRNDAFRAVLEEAAAEMGCAVDDIEHNYNFDSCYCSCPDGPCEHDFQGSFPIGLEEGEPEQNALGFESRCTRCGMGAMHHSLMCAEI